MSALTRFDEARNDLMLSPFDDLFRRFLRNTSWPAERMPQDMKLDISENDKEYVIKAEIPGAKKDEIQVKVDRQFVSISADVKEEKKETQKQDGERILLQEMRYGHVERAFTLPGEVDGKDCVAKYDNGVLTLTLPKRGPSTSKTIAVQ